MNLVFLPSDPFRFAVDADLLHQRVPGLGKTRG